MEDYEKLREGDVEDLAVDIVWEDIRCSVKTPTTNKQILKGISGHALHGEFLVIMGSSGAGKTTLLNILCKRLKDSKEIQVSGNILANGQPLEKIDFANYSGYVTQEDLLIPTMTVFETLLFVARLKTTHPDKVLKVNELIKELKLEDCKNTLVGNQYIKGISGGEKKRTSIGVELMTNPSVLFLDEPTSGLDSYTALLVAKLLVEKAKEGKTIISTIHQPSSDIYNLFDKLMLMADGQVVYHGVARESTSFFADQGLVCPVLDNPADYYMQVLYIENTNQQTESELKLIEDLVTANRKKTADFELLKTPLTSKVAYNVDFKTQIKYLTQREFLRMFRNPILMGLRLLVVLEIIFFTVIIFRDTGNPENEGDFASSAGVIYLLLGPGFIINLLTTVLTFPTQLPIFQKEYRANMYGVMPYCISITIVDVVGDLVLSTLLVSGSYWVINFRHTTKAVLYFYAVIFLVYSIGGGAGNLLGSLVDNPQLALMLTSPVSTPTLTFTGYNRGKNLPGVIKWCEYLSSVFYGFQALMKTQFEDETFGGCTCSTENDCSNCSPLDMYDVRVDAGFCVAMLLGIALAFRFASIGVNIVKSKKLKSLT
jgi:ABC-type multidrug transport system ATPase subunit/ABC-type multidrug transport system permease subunit